ncbi:DUF924 family protein [Halovulum sp. GXIMD14793]
MVKKTEQIIDFWINEVGPAGWYMPPEGLDEQIHDRFQDDWTEAMQGDVKGWTCSPTAALALVILLDQFPRNMFRGTAKAYASDGKALALAKLSISRGHDLATPEPARQFFYMPLEHSESLPDQDQCVRMMSMNMNSPELLKHAKAHREVIRKFGRFPYRNEHLDRASTEAELEYLKAGGYSFTLNQIAA